MSKIVNSRKSIKIEEIPNGDSDSEIEINNKVKVPVVQAVVEPIPDQRSLVAEKKPRRPYTMSEETRLKKSEAMKAVREKKMDNTVVRKQQKEEIMLKEEEELQKKVLKRIAEEKKKREKVLYQKLLEEDLNKPYACETAKDQRSEADVEQKPPKKRKAPVKKVAVPKTPRVPRAPKVQETQLAPIEAPSYYQPAYQYPALNYF